jgi:hypothetical protein
MLWLSRFCTNPIPLNCLCTEQKSFGLCGFVTAWPHDDDTAMGAAHYRDMVIFAV